MKTTHRSIRAAAAGVVLAAAGALLAAAPAQAATTAVHDAGPGVVFAQSDDTGGNTVVAYDRAADGALTQAGVYPTGGLGGVLDGSAVDHLASQHSLVYDQAHHLLYAVNAGSNTVTVFQVDGDRLTRTQVVGSGGEFPVSLAVRGDRVYVLNALGTGSVQGFVREGCNLVPIADWHRGLGLTPVTGPMQFTHTPAQVSFTPDGSALVVTTKANGNSIDVFPFDHRGTPAAAPVQNVEPNAVPFGFAFDPAGRLVVTEAGPNAVATFTLTRDGKATQVSSVATGQAATCWIVRDGHTYYASNAGSASLSGFREGRHGLLTALGNTTTGAGTTDATVSPDGRYLYVQTGAAGVVDGFQVQRDGSLTPVGSVTVPDGVGGEGIVAV
ncbi:beta-propeller fold lactonase family protein [Streptacidiphilus sp. P02-A3a]|uniref:lactonase family protein n=1 Tax=Streptacidiphilus sp. P02-A3a TaxID=2704468 RepID=UPI0015FAFF2A|nr:beta-propeller fold lactonase family protein [Streptacidiphilus sp. P02-A3a]QMU73012.1 lactonase family protein [Streptacidiphilus sp. P02-A3a]